MGTARSSSGARRRLWLVLPLLLVAFALALLSHPGRAAVQVMLLLPEMFVDAPVRPLRWFGAPPRHEEFGFESPTGRVDSDLYLPESGGRHGALVLFTGAFGLRRDANLVRLAEGLARSGAVVAVPESANLLQGEPRADEVVGLLEVVRYLSQRQEVDPGRIGLLGFSAGGSLALLAAEDPVGHVSEHHWGLLRRPYVGPGGRQPRDPGRRAAGGLGGGRGDGLRVLQAPDRAIAERERPCDPNSGLPGEAAPGG